MTTSAPYSQGQMVRVTQQVPRLDRAGGGTMTTTVEGTVVKMEQSKSGSWYAHAKDGKVWVDRLTLRKADGEMVVLNLDQYSVVEVVG